MDDLDVPAAVLRLWRQYGYAGSSLELENARAEVKMLWSFKSNGKGGGPKWRSLLGRVMTRVARLGQGAGRDEALGMLRTCGQPFKAKTLMSWRPHVLIVLGLLGEPLRSIQQLDPRFVQKRLEFSVGHRFQAFGGFGTACSHAGPGRATP